ncbi:MAG: hypothetical protein R3C29_03180 [Dehalococcoidia bacterium]
MAAPVTAIIVGDGNPIFGDEEAEPEPATLFWLAELEIYEGAGSDDPDGRLIHRRPRLLTAITVVATSSSLQSRGRRRS